MVARNNPATIKEENVSVWLAKTDCNGARYDLPPLLLFMC
jgi:hypothetical protein